MSASRVRDEAKKDPDTLAREIDKTRADVGRTLDALQARLSPGQLLDQMLGLAREHGGEFARNLGNSVKQNPMPVVLTGVGLLWMMASRNTTPAQPASYDAPYDYYGYEGAEAMPGAEIEEGDGGGVRQAAESARERVSQAAQSARGRVSRAAGAVSERFGRASGTTRVQAQRARESFSRVMEEQPLVAGAIALAIGAAIGAMLPPSEREDRLLGQARDRALESAASAVRTGTQEAGAQQPGATAQ